MKVTITIQIESETQAFLELMAKTRKKSFKNEGAQTVENLCSNIVEAYVKGFVTRMMNMQESDLSDDGSS